MTLFSIFIFNRFGDVIFSKQWKRTRSTQEGEANLIGGFVYTLQQISSQLSSTGNGGLRAVQTPLYKLNYYETMTGYRVALLTEKDADTALMQTVLSDIFSKIFLRTVARSPTYCHAQGVVIADTAFGEQLDELLRSRNLL